MPKGMRPNAQPYASSSRPVGPIRIVTYLRARCPEVSHGLGVLEREEVKEKETFCDGGHQDRIHIAEVGIT